MTIRKETWKKIFVLILTGISLVICFGGLSAADSEAKKEGDVQTRNIVAKVNGQPIYDDVLNAAVERDLKKFRKFGKKKEDDTHGLIKELQKKALEKIISQELLYQASQNVTIPKQKLDEKIQEKLDAMKNRYNSDEEFEKSLKAKNLTEKELRESFRKSVYLEEYLKEKGISDPRSRRKRQRNIMRTIRPLFRGRNLSG